MSPRIITVFGSGCPQTPDPAYQTACDLGRAIAQAGWTLCNGGYGGTMEAAAKGAVEAGGHTIGVTCAVFGRPGANPHIEQEVHTPDLLTRLNTLVKRGDAFVVLPGGTGTLLELALVWELSNKGLGQRDGPIVLLGNHWTPLIELIRRDTPDASELRVAPTACDVIRLLQAFWQ